MTIELNEIEQEKAVALAMLKAIDLQIKADKIDGLGHLTEVQIAQIDFYRRGQQFYRQLAQKLKANSTVRQMSR